MFLLRSHFLRVVVFSFVTLAAFNAHARPLSKEEVPESLRPWIGWVLRGHEEKLCPHLHDASISLCAWPSRLDLSLDEKSGHFSQNWRVYTEGWVPLPGDERYWPMDVRLDGRPAAVVSREDHPQIYLKAGDHPITGSFSWDSLPESFPLPPEVGLLHLTVRGTTIEHPALTEEGLLWIQSKKTEEAGEESLDFRIHRRMTDEIPFLLTTRINLDVSGKTREVIFAKLLPDGFVPMSLENPLPAHLEEDGRLRVQVRAGNWTIELKARHIGPVTEIRLPKLEQATGESANADLASENEVWVFEPRNDLRLATLEGVPAVDPQQTSLPDDWKRLAAYRMKPGDTIKFREERRGDSEPAPDQLSMTRTLWLDFNGRGYTLQDQISGTFHRSSRLEMNQPVRLGRVSVDGKDQLITGLPGDDKAGIEIRRGQANISADSRIEGCRITIPAIGWNHNFQSVIGTLHLPPGWRVFAVSGADQVPNTWLNRWNLWEIFFVLILSLSAAKIWGRRWGGVALATLTLTFPENRAPQWIWLAVLVGEGLWQLLSKGFKGRIRIPLKLYRTICFVLLLTFVIPFAILHLREALYPSLEKPTYGIPPPPPMAPAAAPAPLPQAEEAQVGGMADMERSTKMAAPTIALKERGFQKGEIVVQNVMRKNVYNAQLIEQRPGTQVQTGPGLPRWSWQQLPLRWSGPVGKEQKLRIFLFPPWFNLFLAFLRVALLALLVCRALNLPAKFWPAFLKKYLVPILLLSLVTLPILVTPAKAAADFPSQELLNELRESLLQPPDCSPNCASISRMRLEATPSILRIRMEVSAEAATAIPLPGSATNWSPQQASIDGGRFAGVQRSDDGQLWLELPAGAHQVILEGPFPPLSNGQTVQIPLPLKPHHVEAQLQGWSLEGLHEDGLADDNLQFTRLGAVAETTLKGPQASKTGPNNLPPFVRVERRLSLGLTWNIETRVVRMTPTGSGISLEIPLLEGESVTSEGVRIKEGKVQTSLGPLADEFVWNSILKESKTIALKAPDSLSWTEIWELDASPIWHILFDGIPVVHHHDEEGTWLPEWRPWPGESVAIKISRPEGVPGQTVTIDRSLLTASPGLRFSEFNLSFGLRSSLGGQHIITLPVKSELQSVTINSVTQPIRAVGDKVTLPLMPGSQDFEVKWQQPEGIRLFFRIPKIDLGTPSVNAEIQINLPQRWIFLVCGPRLGPAVLFWSLLVVLALVSFGLARLGLTPLKFHHWLLLSLGLSQIPIWASLLVAGWLLTLGWRKQNPRINPYLFDLVQILLFFLTVTALITLFVSLRQGLLGVPDMQILGNSSSSVFLKWYQDRIAGVLPRPWVFSLPLFCYRLAMLAWALWIALALLGWLKWGWKCFSASGLWQPIRLVKRSK